MKTVEGLINDHYRRQTLPADRVAAILASGEQRQRRSVPAHPWLAAAGLAAVLVLGLTLSQRYFGAHSVSELVMAEVAMNHRQRLAVEVTGDDFAAVQSALDQLGFSFQRPPSVDPTLALLGGRYCSIHGALAVQLKLHDSSSDRRQTLFATRLTAELERLGTLQTQYNDVRMKVWQEQGVFFVLASDRSQATGRTGRDLNRE